MHGNAFIGTLSERIKYLMSNFVIIISQETTPEIKQKLESKLRSLHKVQNLFEAAISLQFIRARNLYLLLWK